MVPFNWPSSKAPLYSLSSGVREAPSLLGFSGLEVESVQGSLTNYPPARAAPGVVFMTVALHYEGSLARHSFNSQSGPLIVA